MTGKTGTLVILTDAISQSSGRNAEFLRATLSSLAQGGFSVQNVVDLTSTQGQIIITVGGLGYDDHGTYREIDIRGTRPLTFEERQAQFEPKKFDLQESNRRFRKAYFIGAAVCGVIVLCAFAIHWVLGLVAFIGLGTLLAALSEGLS